MHEVTVTAKATNDDFSDVDELMSKFGYKPKKNVQIEPDNSWKTEIIYPRIGLELIAVSAICGILYLNVKSNE